MSKHHLSTLGVIVTLVLALSACVPTSTVRPVENLTDMGGDEVLIVGRIELLPTLEAGEQALDGQFEQFRNRALIVTDEALRDAEELRYGDLSTRIDAPLDELFFVRHRAEPFYLLKTWVAMRAEMTVTLGRGDPHPGSGFAPLQGTFSVAVRPEDKAIYIGTIRYHRDIFFGTEKVEIVDEYAAALAEYQRKFGEGLALRKALVQPMAGS